MSEFWGEVVFCIILISVIGLVAYAIDPSVDDKDWFRKWVNDE